MKITSISAKESSIKAMPRIIELPKGFAHLALAAFTKVDLPALLKASTEKRTVTPRRLTCRSARVRDSRAVAVGGGAHFTLTGGGRPYVASAIQAMLGAK
jgi:hypothetical protein